MTDYVNAPELPFPKEEFSKRLALLDADERRMVELRWGLTHERGVRATLSEIATEFGGSREWVRLRLRVAVIKMMLEQCP